MIEQDVCFDAALGTSKLDRREDLVESNDNSLFLKRNLRLRELRPCWSRKRAKRSTTDLEQRRWPVFIGVGRRGAAGRFGNALVHPAARGSMPVRYKSRGGSQPCRVGKGAWLRMESNSRIPLWRVRRGVPSQGGELSTGENAGAVDWQWVRFSGPSSAGGRSAKAPQARNHSPTLIIGGSSTAALHKLF